jgi:protein-tyrosine-phosphatase
MEPGTKAVVRVLFICTENSARSQMAEGLARSLGRGRVEAFSAGVEPQPMHSLAIRAMRNASIDISAHHSKHWLTLADKQFDYVITVCDKARERCPTWILPHEDIHWSIADPALATGTESERLAAFTKALVELRNRVSLFLISNRITG